jgi:hypothetical protein
VSTASAVGIEDSSIPSGGGFNVEISNEDKVKKHMVSEHHSNMSLLFYDFNNSS